MKIRNFVSKTVFLRKKIFVLPVISPAAWQRMSLLRATLWVLILQYMSSKIILIPFQTKYFCSLFLQKRNFQNFYSILCTIFVKIISMQRNFSRLSTFRSLQICESKEGKLKTTFIDVLNLLFSELFKKFSETRV